MATISATPQIPAKTPKPSIAGFLMALFSLPLSGIGYGLARAHFHSTHPDSKVSEAVAAGTGHVIGSILSLPFLVGGFTLAALGLVFVLARLGRKPSGSSMFFSIVSLLISFWSFSLVVHAFHLLKAH